ncbi:MAG: putative membrane protein [Polyangiales bacterium]|jgi:putative membrane protein
MSLLISWATLTFSLFVASKLLKGMTITGGVGSHMGVAALYGVLLFAFGWCLHLIIGTLSFGLLFIFTFLGRLLVGTILLMVTDKLSKHLTINGFGTAFMAALIGALTSSAAEYAYSHFAG